MAVMLLALAAQVAFGATAEHTATLEAFAGEVKILKGGTASAPPSVRMALRSKDVVYTGKDSAATIVFPDGSAVQLEPKTRFTIQLLEYSQGQRRRSFTLHYGAVVARISRFFGVGSKASIATPTAVAAARGTGFRLSYDALTQLTILSVSDGTVEFTCGGITTMCGAGETIIAKGHKPGPPQGTPETMGTFAGQIAALATFEQAPVNETPSVLEAVVPQLITPAQPEPTPTPTTPVPEGVFMLPETNEPPTQPTATMPPFTPNLPQPQKEMRRMDWTLPGILGAGVLAAVLTGGGGSRGEPTAPVPEPGSLMALGIGVSGIIGMAIRSRKSRRFNLVS